MPCNTGTVCPGNYPFRFIVMRRSFCHAADVVGDDHPVAATTVQRLHAALAMGVGARQRCLSACNGFVIEFTDELVGSLPGFTFGFANDYMQTHAEADASPLSCRTFAHIREFGGNLMWSFTPRPNFPKLQR